MLDRAIRWSLHNRAITLCAAAFVMGLGIYAALTLPVDVFPDLTAPSVTVLAEAHGMAAEEVERLVTLPIETAVNGATGVRRVRSSSAYGISIVWVDFDWETDVYKARQVVTERLQLLGAGWPAGVSTPVMAPMASIMGEIMLIGLRSDLHDDMEVRTAADYQLRRRLLSVPGVAQVIPIGGAVRQFQVHVNPDELKHYSIALSEVLEAVSESNHNASGGIIRASGREILVRGLGRVRTPEEIEHTVITVRDHVPVLVRDVAHVTMGPRTRLGTGSVNGEPAVILSIQKQPTANTLLLTELIDAELESVQKSLPEGMVIVRDIFRQADFISLAVNNVVSALREGAILVILIVFLFLWSPRATTISVLAIPLALCTALIAMMLTGTTVNTMTLGGMAIAIGALVDDAIIDVENVHRRMRERPGEPPMEVVYDASREIRGPIMNATVIICVVFLPFFFLGGVEGRLLQPLGFAYVISVAASLIVAVTVTPALCSLLLPRVHLRESWLSNRLLQYYQPVLSWSMKHRNATLIAAGVLLAGTVALVPFLGRGFLPPFQEGSLVANAVTVPGTSLIESDHVGQLLERIILEHPAVTGSSRRTGRAELDEHAQGSNASEIDIQLDLSQHELSEVLADLRERVSHMPGLTISFGQPMGHRIDHMLSGSRSNLAIKLFGPELRTLRQVAEFIRQEIEGIPGVVDLAVEQQADVPQLRLYLDRMTMARYGVTSEHISDFVEAAFAGTVVSTILEGDALYDLTVRYEEDRRDAAEDIERALLPTGGGSVIELGEIAHVQWERGVNTISRENVQRLIVIGASVSGRDAGRTMDEVRSRLEDFPLPEGYYIRYGGQIETASRAARTLLLLSIASLIIIYLVLYKAFARASAALLVLVNLPLALTGGLISLLIFGGQLNIAAMVGFITLFGIAVRNGLLLVSHYQALEAEGKSLQEAVIQGSMERLNPILMTALTAALALLPLALGGGEPGREIQSPMAIVILGGLITSTFLNMVIVPILYARYMRPSPAKSR